MIRLRSREQLGICEFIGNPDKLLGKRIDFCIKRSCKNCFDFHFVYRKRQLCKFLHFHWEQLENHSREHLMLVFLKVGVFNRCELLKSRIVFHIETTTAPSSGDVIRLNATY